jgi:hypothetical protein
MAFRDFAYIVGRVLERDSVRLGAARQWLAAAAERAEKVARLAGQKSSPVRLIASVDRPVSGQVVEALSGVSFDRVVALSPFHSSDAGPLRRLAARIGCEEVWVAIDGQSLVTPVREGSEGVSFVRRAEVDDNRPTHAKWYEFVGAQPWRLTGSVNATRTSLESIDNIEVAALRPVTGDRLLHWLPCKPEATGVPPSPIDSIGGRLAIVTTVLSARVIAGRFLSKRNSPDGLWAARLLRQGVEQPLPPVDVVDGAFEIRLPQDLAIDEVEPCQLRLGKGDFAAIGWLMHEADLQLPRAEREFSRRVKRLTRDNANADDFVEVISWLAGRIGHLVGTPKGAVVVTRPVAQQPSSEVAFDYSRWVSTAHFGKGPHASELGACRVVLSALARFASNPHNMAARVAVSGGGMGDFGSQEDDGGDEQDSHGGNASPVEGQMAESLQSNIERALEAPALEPEVVHFLLEALLWTLTIVRRPKGDIPLDALPFAQWAALAKPHLAKHPRDPALALLALGAMCCAFALNADDSGRLESFAVLARRAAAVDSSEDLPTQLANLFDHSPGFSKLSRGQVAKAIIATPELLRYTGFATQLAQYLTDWSAASGNLAVSAELDSKTRGAIGALRTRRGMADAYAIHADGVPTNCLPRCYNVFDKSDQSVLRHWRGLRCNRCGKLHFWTGTE